jgi:plastocyanin
VKHLRLTSRAVLAVPLVLVSCSSGSTGTGSVTTVGPAAAQTATVEMRNDLKYHPSTVKARVGKVTLTVSNTESVPHDLVFDDPSLGKITNLDGKESKLLVVTFAQAGTFRFACTIHPGMTGEVVVR